MIKINHKDLKVKKKFIGIKYKLNGRDFKGTDCLGLIWLFLKDNGIDIPESDGLPISKDWWRHDPNRYINGLYKLGAENVFVKEIERLDIILFINSATNRAISHSAIMLNKGWFLHILENRKSEVQIINKYWLSRLDSILRIR